MVRLQPEQVAEVDAWGERQGDKPSRPESIRRLVSLALQDHQQATPEQVTEDGRGKVKDRRQALRSGGRREGEE